MLKNFYDIGKLPWINCDDMSQANTNSLIRTPVNEDTWEEYETCKYAFFPGCQLTASEPDLVLRAYDWLCFHYPDTAIFMHCCGTPAKWSSATDSLKSNTEFIRNKWVELGNPVMIMGCMTCMKTFIEYLPEIPVVSLYDMIAKSNDYELTASNEYIYFTFAEDHEKSTCDALTSMAEEAGTTLHSMESTGMPMLTHCINSRDMLITDHIESVHILELLFNENDEPAPLPSYEERCENRENLRQLLLELFWE